MRIFINCEDCGREETQIRTEEKCNFVLQRNLSLFKCETESFEGRGSVGTCQKCFSKRHEHDEEHPETNEVDMKKREMKVHWV